MRFKIDHNLPAELAGLLREAGHEAATAMEQGLAEADDDVLAARCLAESRCLMTLDMGFSNIRAYPPENYAGIVVLRFHRQDKPSVLAMGRATVRLLESEAVSNRLWIIEPDRIRIHEGGKT